MGWGHSNPSVDLGADFWLSLNLPWRENTRSWMTGCFEARGNETNIGLRCLHLMRCREIPWWPTVIWYTLWTHFSDSKGHTLSPTLLSLFRLYSLTKLTFFLSCNVAEMMTADLIHSSEAHSKHMRQAADCLPWWLPYPHFTDERATILRGSRLGSGGSRPRSTAFSSPCRISSVIPGWIGSSGSSSLSLILVSTW